MRKRAIYSTSEFCDRIGLIFGRQGHSSIPTHPNTDKRRDEVATLNDVLMYVINWSVTLKRALAFEEQCEPYLQKSIIH